MEDGEIASIAKPERIASHRVALRERHSRCNASRPIILLLSHILSGLGSPDYLFGKQATINRTLHESEGRHARGAVDP